MASQLTLFEDFIENTKSTRRSYTSSWHPNFLVNPMSTDHTRKQTQSHSQSWRLSNFWALLPANTTHFLSCTRATNEGIAVLEVWSIFSFVIKRILGIKHIFPCSFENKRMRLLTRVYLEDKQFRNRLVINSLLKSFGPRLPRQWQTQMDSRIGD